MPLALILLMQFVRRHSDAAFLRSMVLMAGLAAGSICAANQQLQSTASIREVAREHVTRTLPASDHQVIVTSGHLDARLRLPACDQPLAATRPATSSWAPKVTVQVSCPAGNGWTVYVPVTIETELPVLVVRRSVARGSALGLDDVVIERRTVHGLPAGYISTPDALTGRHAKRTLSAGTLLTADALAADRLVERGQQVTLLSQVGGIEVRAAGRALMAGGARERIRVQNVNSARVIEGFVESADIVRVAP